jgi:phosphotransferase system  glucose/maltose/N-acetylglucosamine-specific IIC component
LLDLSFRSFVTSRVIPVLYVVSLVLLGIAYVVIAIALFTSGNDSVSVSSDGTLERDSGGSVALGLLWLLIIGPIVLFFYTLLYRVVFELIIVLFRIYENTRDGVALLRGGTIPAAAPGPEPGFEPPSPI